MKDYGMNEWNGHDLIPCHSKAYSTHTIVDSLRDPFMKSDLSTTESLEWIIDLPKQKG
jgi:hypothetical protein